VQDRDDDDATLAGLRLHAIDDHVPALVDRPVVGTVGPAKLGEVVERQAAPVKALDHGLGGDGVVLGDPVADGLDLRRDLGRDEDLMRHTWR
jgi:hypothetical protein